MKKRKPATPPSVSTCSIKSSQLFLSSDWLDRDLDKLVPSRPHHMLTVCPQHHPTLAITDAGVTQEATV